MTPAGARRRLARGCLSGLGLLGLGLGLGLLLAPRSPARPAPRSSVPEARGPLELRMVAGRVFGPRPLERSTQAGTAEGRGHAKRAAAALRAAVVLRSGSGYGAGVLVGGSGLILTVNHVLREPASVRALLADGAAAPAEVMARDATLDLALLRLGGPPGRAAGAPLGSVLGVRAGDELLSIGNPRELAFTLRRGIASFVGRRFGAVRYLQSDLPAEPGSSGSPIFDESGRVVALISFIVRDGERLAFAIPVDYAVEAFAALRPIAQLSLEARTRFERWRRDLAEAPVGPL